MVFAPHTDYEAFGGDGTFLQILKKDVFSLIICMTNGLKVLIG